MGKTGTRGRRRKWTGLVIPVHFLSRDSRAVRVTGPLRYIYG